MENKEEERKVEKRESESKGVKKKGKQNVREKRKGDS